MDDLRVRVVNTALTALGQDPVEDLLEASLDASMAAVKVLRVLDDARDTVLATHGFFCAMTYGTLQVSIIPDQSNWKYPYTFLLPADALAVWEIEGTPLTEFYSPAWCGRWEIGTTDGPRQFIRAKDSCPLNAGWTRRADWGALSVLVRDAVAYEAAYRSAVSVTGDAATMKSLEGPKKTKLTDAISKDGTQGGGDPPLAPSIPAMIRASSR